VTKDQIFPSQSYWLRKTFSLALTSGIDLKGHLERMQSDPAAKQLGFDVDAKLLDHMVDNSKGSAVETFKDAESFNSEITDMVKLDEDFSIASWAGTSLLLEGRYHQPDFNDPRKLDSRTRERIETLVKLLQQPRERAFRIPPCLWWTHVADKRKILLAFSIESGLGQPPTSLQHLLALDLKLSLNKKFALAYSLAKCLSQFQLVGWVSSLGSSPKSTT
jgi:hypothetical protein